MHRISILIAGLLLVLCATSCRKVRDEGAGPSGPQAAEEATAPKAEAAGADVESGAEAATGAERASAERTAAETAAAQAAHGTGAASAAGAGVGEAETADEFAPEWPDGAELRSVGSHQPLYDAPATSEEELLARQGRFGANFRWDAATDNVAVLRYEMHKDGELLGPVPGTETEFTYETKDDGGHYRLDAVDAAGNRASLKLEHPPTPWSEFDAPVGVAGELGVLSAGFDPVGESVTSLLGDADPSGSLDAAILGMDEADIDAALLDSAIGDLSGVDVDSAAGEDKAEPPTEPDEVGRELLELCAIAEQVNADLAISAEMRPMEIATRFKATAPTEETQTIMRSLAGAAPGKHLSVLAEAAREHGVVDFSCEALEGP